MLSVMKTILQLALGLSLVCFLACSDDDDDDNDDIGDVVDEIEEEIDDGDLSRCVGTWNIVSAVLDGEQQDTLGSVWTIGPENWLLQTVVCSSSGTTDIDGDDISMTVGTQNCADPIPAPEGRTASGTCTADDNTMTMTLSHDLEGTMHTLTVTGTRQ